MLLDRAISIGQVLRNDVRALLLSLLPQRASEPGGPQVHAESRDDSIITLSNGFHVEGR